MPDVCFLSSTLDIIFIPQKVDLKKLAEKQLNFSSSFFLLFVENWATFIIFFHLSFPKVLYKTFIVYCKSTL